MGKQCQEEEGVLLKKSVGRPIRWVTKSRSVSGGGDGGGGGNGSILSWISFHSFLSFKVLRFLMHRAGALSLTMADHSANVRTLRLIVQMKSGAIASERGYRFE